MQLTGRLVAIRVLHNLAAILAVIPAVIPAVVADQEAAQEVDTAVIKKGNV